MPDDTLGINRDSATSIDGAPVYDAITENDHLSPTWRNWFASLIDTITAYLSPYGIFIPKMSTTDRDTIQTPQTGQLIFNTTTDTLQIYLSTGWENVTTAP